MASLRGQKVVGGGPRQERRRAPSSCCSSRGARSPRSTRSPKSPEAEALRRAGVEVRLGALARRASGRAPRPWSSSPACRSPGPELAAARAAGAPLMRRGRARLALPARGRRARCSASPAPTARAPPPRCSGELVQADRASSTFVGGNLGRAFTEAVRREATTPTWSSSPASSSRASSRRALPRRGDPEPHARPPRPLREPRRRTARPRRASSRPSRRTASRW